jgi:glycosyltransferase involved in cell wall biosynthesis
MNKDRKKIVLLSAFYDPFMSGAEQMAKEIAERLGLIHDIILVTARLDRELARTEKRANFRLVRVGFGWKNFDKILYPFLAVWQIRKINPEIAHAIMESYAGGALVLVKYFSPSVKRILTLQSGDLDDARKQKKFIVKFFWRLIHTSPNFVTAISGFLAERAIRLGVPREKVAITPNGIDFNEVPQNISKEKNRVICVARLSWEKGLNFLLAAWPKVLAEFSDAKLVFVGEGDKRAEIEKQIEELNLENSVELKGRMSHSETLIEIAKSEVFVCPSLAEGLGNVFIEAQACGTPAIGTRVGGIPDVIKDGISGLLIEPKNSMAIATALLRLLKDVELRQELARNGLEGTKQFDWRKIIEKINEIYYNLKHD